MMMPEVRPAEELHVCSEDLWKRSNMAMELANASRANARKLRDRSAHLHLLHAPVDLDAMLRKGRTE